eukprot:5897641-Pyramimonas_sp.AAC.1
MGDYVPKNILLTGGAGFIASHATYRLVKNYPQYKVGFAFQTTNLKLHPFPSLNSGRATW